MNNRILICQIDQGEWSVVSNPKFEPPFAEYFGAIILNNALVPYVEYENCGVTYRVIRKSDAKRYRNV